MDKLMVSAVLGYGAKIDNTLENRKIFYDLYGKNQYYCGWEKFEEIVGYQEFYVALKIYLTNLFRPAHLGRFGMDGEHIHSFIFFIIQDVDDMHAYQKVIMPQYKIIDTYHSILKNKIEEIGLKTQPIDFFIGVRGVLD